ncbi:hypothetical protein BV898_03273 [Hypsibius exemplaris]|uniref:MARVEL domain-containing protein n=1 Tax=Hypsibius exemplaris TaxID=2072580 RepID=A0A1W0X667_HYPEX|nr:hypothetical protein BV898_03273 [Hypsibius exemplaris]
MATMQAEWVTPTTTTRTISSGIRFDIWVLKSVNAALKLSVILFDLVAISLAAAGNQYDEPYYLYGSSQYAIFACLSAMVHSIVVLLIYLFNLTPWPILEIINLAISALVVFIAGCLMIPYAYLVATRGATVAFAWAAAVLYMVDFFLKFRKGRKNGTLGTPSSMGSVAGGKY